MLKQEPETAVAYNGRKTSRTGSERRRRAILEAALRIVVRDGVRGVRHRAVAKEAEVPLSATTYYFKDISDLIADTFVLFAESSVSGVVDPIESKVNEYIDSMEPGAIKSLEGKVQLVSYLGRVVTTYIMEELKGRREHLMAEQAFMLEALRDPRLRGLALQYKDRLQKGLLAVCEVLESEHPKNDAWIMLNSIMQTEHENLLKDIAAVDVAEIEGRFIRLFKSLFCNI